MAVPARPVEGAPVETTWGQGVHDQSFTPRGAVANSANVTGIGTTVVILPLTVGGPNLSGGAFVAPEPGVYRYSASVVCTPLGGAANIRLYAYANGVAVAGSGGWIPTGGTAGATALVAGTAALTAGQTLDFRMSGSSGTSGLAATCYAHIEKVGEALA